MNIGEESLVVSVLTLTGVLGGKGGILPLSSEVDDVLRLVLHRPPVWPPQ